MNGFFITGTDTGIGKTVLSALLLAELRRRAIHAAPMKPVQTGCGGQRPEARGQASGVRVPDLDYSLSMAGMTASDDDYKNMAPYRFEPACSPHLAAELAGTEIEIARIVSAAQTLTSEYNHLIVEGAGGILVPLNRQELMLDLMVALKLPVLLAARPGLGTINHTLLSIRTLQTAGLHIAGVVFVASEEKEPSLFEEDNAFTIKQFGNVPPERSERGPACAGQRPKEVAILGTIPFCPQLREPHPAYSALSIIVISAVEKVVNKLAI
jgi:dethiobiotin synthetase